MCIACKYTCYFHVAAGRKPEQGSQVITELLQAAAGQHHHQAEEWKTQEEEERREIFSFQALTIV